MATSSLSSENEGKDHTYQILENPGPRGAYETRQINGGFYIRVDMPGVPPDGVKLFKRGKTNTVTFTGKAPRLWDDCENSDRVYGGYVILDRNPDEVDVDMTVVNGSLRLFFPAAEGILHFFPRKNPQQCPVLDMTCSHINPYLLDGTEGVVESQRVCDGHEGRMYIRIDMPGLGEKNNNIKFEKGVRLLYKEEGSKDRPLDEGGRTYAFRFTLLCNCCKIIRLKHEIKHGVLRVSFTRLTTCNSSTNCALSLQRVY